MTTQPDTTRTHDSPRYVDLHMHSTASDGTDAPEALADLARAAGLSAIALTDHDTTAGLSACKAACNREGVEFVPGIEVSADPGPVSLTGAGDGTEPPDTRRGTLHILGLFIVADDPTLDDIARRMREARDQRNPRIVALLRQQGIDITHDQVLDFARSLGSTTVGRPHIAQVLMRLGVVRSVSEAFERFLGRGGSAFVRRDQLPPEQAIDAIHHAGGLAILAHPVQLKIADPRKLEQYVRRLKDIGLDGVETRHSDHSADDVSRFESLARRLDLFTSGGSDYHGTRKDVAMGGQRVPFNVFERLREAARS